MKTFDFDGFSAVTFGTGLNVSISTVIQDTTPSGPVSFTVSSQATFSALRPLFSNLRIVDRTDAGFEVVPLDVDFFSVPITQTLPFPPFFETIGFQQSPLLGAARTLNLSFELNTTPSRTAFDTATTPILVQNGVPVSGTISLDGSTVRFTFSNVDFNGLNISELRVGFTCFCAGTRIATPQGACAVEDVTPGDLVRTASGRDVEVLWVGRQMVNTNLSNPAEANPIRITRGALGGGLPERDLRVSPDHAIAIDGLLINAGALVNGTTIYQERDVNEAFTYYHIETDTHELILAEGVAAETFVDYTTRDTFENADEAADRVIQEMPLPRISSARLVPDRIKQRLLPLMAAQ